MEEESKKVSIGRIITNIIMCILLVIVITLGMIIIKIMSNNNVIIFGYQPYVVLSGDTTSELSYGDLAFSKKVNSNEVKANDIAVIKDKSENIVTYKIDKIIYENNIQKIVVKLSDTKYLKINLNDIEGIYDFKISNIGKLILFMKEKATLIMLISLISISGGIAIYICCIGSKEEVEWKINKK